jgi:hypothetical protein
VVQNVDGNVFDVNQIVDSDAQQRLSVEHRDPALALELMQGQVFFDAVALSAAHDAIRPRMLTLGTNWDDVIAGVKTGMGLLDAFFCLPTAVETLSFRLFFKGSESQNEIRER